MEKPKLKTVMVDGVWYLCELRKDGDSVVLGNAIKWTGDKTFTDWMTHYNIGHLSTKHLSNNCGYTVDELDEEQARVYARAWEDMQEVKRQAVRRLENDYFKGDR